MRAQHIRKPKGFHSMLPSALKPYVPSCGVWLRFGAEHCPVAYGAPFAENIVSSASSGAVC